MTILIRIKLDTVWQHHKDFSFSYRYSSVTLNDNPLGQTITFEDIDTFEW